LPLVLTALLWGLVQGLTEFLPISSSGHLVLVPELLGIPAPDLATSAVLHLGTLAAVLLYYRKDLSALLRFRTDPNARHLLFLLVLGTIPAAVAGLTLEGPLEMLFVSPRSVALALMGTGVILLVAAFLPRGRRRTSQARPWEALLVGVAQAVALVPGISRSGTTIAAGLARRLEGAEAARFSFLLAIPAIAGAGFVEGLELGGRGQLSGTVWVGMLTAAVAGYASIALLLRALVRFGLLPFAAYCLLAGTAAFLLVD
jgi:undecaprenyl-diphosphatase